MKGLRSPGGPDARDPPFPRPTLAAGLHPGLALSTQGPGSPPPRPVPSTAVLAPPLGGAGFWSTLFLHLGARRCHTSAPCTYPGAFSSGSPTLPPSPASLRPCFSDPNGGPPRTSVPTPVPWPPLAQAPSPRPRLYAGSIRSPARCRGSRYTCLFPAFAGRFPSGSREFLTWPGGLGPLVPTLSSGSSGLAPSPRAVFYLFLFDIFPLGVCSGMFLLVTCKELL